MTISLLWMGFIAVGQTANFTFTSLNNFCSPATVNFSSQTSANPVGYLWDFGNGQKSNQPNPRISFNTGTYRVRLIVVYERNTAEITKEITIKPTTRVSISSDKEKLCMPDAVSFTATTSGPAVNYRWNFGDSSQSITTTSTQATHNYVTTGNFTASVEITNASGCQSSANVIIKISKPVISGSFSREDGCVPASNSFNAVVSVINNSPVSLYNWNFGDGTSVSTSLGTVTHSYNNAGNFMPVLSITTTDGCTARYEFDSVRYGNSPTNLMAYPSMLTFCGSEKVNFIARADNADSYNWMFGSNSSIMALDTVITHKFSSLGQKNIRVTPMKNNCPGDTVSMVVNVIGAIAKFTYQNTCPDKKTFQFTNISAGRRLTYLWNFGDGNTSNIASPANSFPRRGEFDVKLHVADANSGCVDSADVTIYTANPFLLNSANDICINSNTRFRIINNYTNNNASQTWFLMNTLIGPNTDSIQDIRASILGTYDNYVIVDNGSSYCPDTLRLDHRIVVKGPHVDFSADNNNCLNQAVTVTNMTSSYIPGDVISTYIWNYGDTSLNIQTAQPRPYNYRKEGNYTISLTAIDANGCRDTLSRQIDVRPMPFIWIMPRNAVYCSGNSDTLIGYTSDNILWSSTSPIQGLCQNCDSNLIVAGHSSAIYATVTNIYNCVSKDSVSIKVFEPFTAQSDPDNLFVCEKQQLSLNVGPEGKKVIWTPSTDLSNPTVYNPTASPTVSRIYKATLTDSAGCFSSTKEIAVNVMSNPTIDLDGTKFLPFNSNYTITPLYSSNVASVIWSPATGLNCSYCFNPVTQIDGTKTYTVRAISDSGCVMSKTITLVIECNNAYLLMPGAFTPNNDGKNDIFYPLSFGIRHIRRFAIFNRIGQLMYEKRNFAPNESVSGWNGKYNNSDQPLGTYVYIVEADCDFGQTTIKKGSFVLIR